MSVQTKSIKLPQPVTALGIIAAAISFAAIFARKRRALLPDDNDAAGA
jgi:hypothetical protein